MHLRGICVHTISRKLVQRLLAARVCSRSSRSSSRAHWTTLEAANYVCDRIRSASPDSLARVPSWRDANRCLIKREATTRPRSRENRLIGYAASDLCKVLSLFLWTIRIDANNARRRMSRRRILLKRTRDSTVARCAVVM